MIPRRYQRLKEGLERRQPDLAVLMENVHKPHNLAAVLRTCDAVGAFRIHTVNEFAPLPTFDQVARGSQKWVQLQTHPHIKEAIIHLKKQHFNIYAAHWSESSQDFRNIDYTQPTVLLMGAEKWGVSEEAASLADGHIIIPMLGMVKSLNVSVAAAVILFEAQRQRLEAGFYNHIRLDPETYTKTLFEWCYPELASSYRERGIPYPSLGPNGEILS
ncbi:MAG: tRNA (guanosine(18)-2'-O)-methyltransferase TrmH [Cyanophyceae cyanobacterium]